MLVYGGRGGGSREELIGNTSVQISLVNHCDSSDRVKFSSKTITKPFLADKTLKNLTVTI